MFQRSHDRWNILALTLIMLLASRYCFELPSALKESLELRLTPYMTEEEYEYFYNSFLSIYSLPNIILPFLNGRLIDKYGHNIMIVVCSAITALGHILFAIGLNGSLWRFMIVGRFVFGIGSESLLVSQYSLLTKYFNGQELSLAMTISSSVSIFGNLLNMILTPRLASAWSVDAAVWIGAILCVMGIISTILVSIRNKRFPGHKQPYGFVRQKSGGGSMPEFEVTHFKEFDKIFWYIAFTQFFLFSGITCWVHIGTGFIVEKWFSHKPIKEAQILAGNCLALVWASAVISGPFIGRFVDNYGLRTRVLMVSTIICTVSMTLFALVIPFIPAFLLGFAYSFGAASIFPCVAYVVPSEHIGTANGLVISLENLGYVFYPYIIAFLRVASGDYDMSQILIIISSIAALKFAHMTYQENLKKGYNLDIEVDMMGAVGFEVLELRSRNSEYADYNILNSDDRLYEK